MPDALRWALLLGALGAIAGSFLATVAIRMQRGASALDGRSRCDGCARVLRVRDLVPVLSHLALRGRCRACGMAIDRRHLAIELGCVGIGITAGAVAGPLGIAGATFGWLLLTLAAVDAADLWLPDPLVAALAITGAASAWWFPPEPLDRLIGAAVGFGALWMVGAGYLRLRGREGLGGGDPKLLGAIGLWLGWRLLAPVLLIAALVGLGVVAARHASGRAVAGTDELPFGAYLAVAAYPAWLGMIVFAP